MPFEIILMLFCVGVIAGGVNALAGGASLLSFPALMAAGLPPTIANASNFVAMLPGNAAAIPAYAKEIKNNVRESVKLVVTSLLGGTVGCILLIYSSDGFFLELVPWLILSATLLYAFGEKLNGAISRFFSGSGIKSGWLGYFLMFAFSIYGGYFGAGLGVIILAILKIMGYLDFHEANAMKNLTNSALGFLGVVLYQISGLISWPEALIMMAGATVGGYASAYYARYVSQSLLTNAVIAFGFFLSAYYFLK